MANVESPVRGLGGALPMPAWEGLIRAGAARSYAVGDVLVRQGETGAFVLCLTAGKIKVTRSEPDGSEVLLAVRGPGEVVGVIAAIDGGRRSATVTALQPCVAYALPAARFRAILEGHRLTDQLVRHVVERLREGEDLRSELAQLSAQRRVAAMLLRFAACDTSSRQVIEISQSELAGAAGMSRAAVAAELSALRRAGLVVTGRRRLELLDLAGLRRILLEG
ncbi:MULTISPECIES: Crp/Fnr family transcriptional regulator [Nonomuraea]|uniref:Crp/Fnr family transcriptional regulator n=1 Tax=Nonomuraea TaxID=83681 RepID=UPI0029BADDB1|nr:Crp/Fnr family transcriptional regulator [Nonomuraea angiospora]MDX3101454.1 Crp/Fnr family transcriptional regulator [Nonomuraea angiospora]